MIAVFVLATTALARAAWWLVEDLLLEHVGIPLLDDASTSGAVRDVRYDRDRRSTGMSRDVRAW